MTKKWLEARCHAVEGGPRPAGLFCISLSGKENTRVGSHLVKEANTNVPLREKNRLTFERPVYISFTSVRSSRMTDTSCYISVAMYANSVSVGRKTRRGVVSEGRLCHATLTQVNQHQGGISASGISVAPIRPHQVIITSCTLFVPMKEEIGAQELIHLHRCVVPLSPKGGRPPATDSFLLGKKAH